MIKKHKKELLPEDIKKKAIDQTFLTMKDLVELCHIKATKLTSAIVGAKYPKTKEEFEKKFGEGGFDESLAGKRMKLTTPVTWETELSQKGNKPEVW
jgi:telomerase protein component 1